MERASSWWGRGQVALVLPHVCHPYTGCVLMFFKCNEIPLMDKLSEECFTKDITHTQEFFKCKKIRTLYLTKRFRWVSISLAGAVFPKAVSHLSFAFQLLHNPVLMKIHSSPPKPRSELREHLKCECLHSEKLVCVALRNWPPVTVLKIPNCQKS